MNVLSAGRLNLAVRIATCLAVAPGTAHYVAAQVVVAERGVSDSKLDSLRLLSQSKLREPGVEEEKDGHLLFRAKSSTTFVFSNRSQLFADIRMRKELLAITKQMQPGSWFTFGQFSPESQTHFQSLFRRRNPRYQLLTGTRLGWDVGVQSTVLQEGRATTVFIRPTSSGAKPKLSPGPKDDDARTVALREGSASSLQPGSVASLPLGGDIIINSSQIDERRLAIDLSEAYLELGLWIGKTKKSIDSEIAAVLMQDKSWESYKAMLGANSLDDLDGQSPTIGRYIRDAIESGYGPDFGRKPMSYSSEITFQLSVALPDERKLATVVI